MTARLVATGLATIILAGFLAGCGSSSPTSPSSVNVAGTWSGNASDSTGPGTMTWQMSQTGTTVSGSVTGYDTHHNVTLANGVLSATLNNATLTFSVVWHGGITGYASSCTVAVNGTASVTATSINGTYSGTNTCGSSFSNGQFSLTKS